MAEVTLKIDISEEQFKKLIKENIESLPQDKVHEIILNALSEQVKSHKKLFIQEGYYGSDVRPTEWLNRLVGGLHHTEAMKGTLEEISEYLKNNYKEVLLNAISHSISNVLFSTENKIVVNDSIFSSINDHMTNHHN